MQTEILDHTPIPFLDQELTVIFHDIRWHIFFSIPSNPDGFVQRYLAT